MRILSLQSLKAFALVNDDSTVIELLVSDDHSLDRLDKFLANYLEGFSRTNVQDLIKNEAVSIDGTLAKAKTKPSIGNLITVVLPPQKPSGIQAEELEIKVLYEDEDIAVIIKPAGMMVHANNHTEAGTLVNALLFHIKKLSDAGEAERPGIVHRLDKDTSGVMLVAKTNEAYLGLVNQFKNHTVEKEYIAIVNGVMEQDEGCIDLDIIRDGERSKMKAVKAGGKESLSLYQVKKRYKKYTLVHVKPRTGRTHQIRVHLKALGHKIVCDELYGTGPKKYEILDPIKNQKITLLSRQALHAHRITFKHPISSIVMTYEAPLFPDIQSVVDSLENSQKRL